jgi:hypothetical protein
LLALKNRTGWEKTGSLMARGPVSIAPPAVSH